MIFAASGLTSLTSTLLIRSTVFSRGAASLCNPDVNGRFASPVTRMSKIAATILEHAKAAEHHRRVAGLRAVASLELAKGVVVLLLGFGAVSLVHKDAWDVAEALCISCT